MWAAVYCLDYPCSSPKDQLIEKRYSGVQTAHCTLKLQRTPEHEGGGGNIVPRVRWKRLQIGFPEFVANIASNV